MEVQFHPWGGSRREAREIRLSSLNLKKYDIKTRWLGLRMPEVPFRRTWILKIFRGIPWYPPQWTNFCSSVLESHSLKSCIRPSTLLKTIKLSAYEYGRNLQMLVTIHCLWGYSAKLETKNLEFNSISGKHELSFDEVFSRVFILFGNLSKTSIH